MRIGHGYDLHLLVPDRKLILGGVEVLFEKGLLGHSDADVLTHAVIDALLGAAALPDIGAHFPDNDPAYKNADSIVLLKKAYHLISIKGYKIVNIDATIIAQRPKLKDYIPNMRKNIATTLCLDYDDVNVKATTEEGVNACGLGKAMAAHCVVLIEKIKTDNASHDAQID